MPELDNIGSAIVKGVLNPEAKDLAVDLGDLELDSLIDESVLKEVPFIKSIIACHKTWTTIRDQLFLRKIAKFLQSCPSFSEQERERFVQEHLNDSKKAKKTSDALVLILHRLDDLEKPEMIAKIFAAFVRGEIGFDLFRRLNTAVDIGFIEDLKEFVTWEPVKDPHGRADAHTRALYGSLLRTGLTSIPRGTGTAPILGVSINVDELGKTFKKCMADRSVK
jgi:hypothetical protein